MSLARRLRHVAAARFDFERRRRRAVARRRKGFGSSESVLEATRPTAHQFVFVRADARDESARRRQFSLQSIRKTAKIDDAALWKSRPVRCRFERGLGRRVQSAERDQGRRGNSLTRPAMSLPSLFASRVKICEALSLSIDSLLDVAGKDSGKFQAMTITDREQWLARLAQPLHFLRNLDLAHVFEHFYRYVVVRSWYAVRIFSFLA